MASQFSTVPPCSASQRLIASGFGSRGSTVPPHFSPTPSAACLAFSVRSACRRQSEESTPCVGQWEASAWRLARRGGSIPREGESGAVVFRTPSTSKKMTRRSARPSAGAGSGAASGSLAGSGALPLLLPSMSFWRRPAGPFPPAAAMPRAPRPPGRDFCARERHTMDIDMS